MPISDIETYFRNYDKTAYSLFTQRGSEPTAKQLEAFEAEIGYRLPDEFREFALHPLGAFYIEVKEEIWPSAKEGEVGPFWTFLRALYVYSLSDEAPAWMQIKKATKRFRDEWQKPYVPFLKIETNADPYCFTPEGKIVIHGHETPDEPEQIDMTFSQVVMKELQELERRNDMKVSQLAKNRTA